MPAGLNHGLNRFKPEGGLNLPTLVYSDLIISLKLYYSLGKQQADVF